MEQDSGKMALFIASVDYHITSFHMPYINYLQSKGYEVHVAAKMGSKQNALEESSVICHNIDFERSPFSISSIKALGQLLKLMKENRFSLSHLHTPTAAVLGRIAAALTKTRPIIYSAHGFHFYKGAPIWNWIIYYTIERMLIHLTDVLITTNKEDYDTTKNFPIRAGGKVVYVPGVGVYAKDYEISDSNIRERIRSSYGFSETDIVVLSIGELNSNKNHIQLISAFERILREQNNAYLLIAGTGELESMLKGRIAEMSSGKHIKLLGFCDNIKDLLAMTDIFAHTSIREGLPRSIMEAMAAGKPVVCTNIRGNKDLVIDGDNGFLVPVHGVEETYQAILELAKNENLRIAMGNKGKKVIEDFSIDNTLRIVSHIYDAYSKL